VNPAANGPECAAPNGRCRLHAGKALARGRRKAAAVFAVAEPKHGIYATEALVERWRVRGLWREVDEGVTCGRPCAHRRSARD
jgi:hypothetical protein